MVLYKRNWTKISIVSKHLLYIKRNKGFNGGADPENGNFGKFDDFPRFTKFSLPKNLSRICVNTMRELLILFIEKFFLKNLQNIYKNFKK